MSFSTPPAVGFQVKRWRNVRHIRPQVKRAQARAEIGVFAASRCTEGQFVTKRHCGGNIVSEDVCPSVFTGRARQLPAWTLSTESQKLLHKSLRNGRFALPLNRLDSGASRRESSLLSHKDRLSAVERNQPPGWMDVKSEQVYLLSSSLKKDDFSWKSFHLNFNCN